VVEACEVDDQRGDLRQRGRCGRGIARGDDLEPLVLEEQPERAIGRPAEGRVS
jgi:hypothetical protein